MRVTALLLGLAAALGADQPRLVIDSGGHQALPRFLTFTRDGKSLVSSSEDKVVRIWDIASGKTIRTILGQVGDGREGHIYAAALSPDEHYLAVGGWLGPDPDSGVIRIHDFHTGEVVTLMKGHTNVVNALAFSGDGRWLASGSSDKTVKIWDTRVEGSTDAQGPQGFRARCGILTRQQNAGLREFRQDTETLGPGLRATPEGDDWPQTEGLRSHLLALWPLHPGGFIRSREQVGDIALRLKGGNDVAILQILHSGQTKHEITRNQTTGARHASFSLSPNGALVASDGDGGVLTLYSTGTGVRTAECVGHTSDVWALAFSPDGKSLVSGSGDQTVRLWDVTSTSCRNLLTVFVGSDNEWVAWTPQGYNTSSANGDKYLGWHVNQGLDHAAKYYPAAQFQKRFYWPDVVAEFLKDRDIDVAVKMANERRGGEFHSQPVLTSANVQEWLPPVISISSPERDTLTATGKTLRVRAEVISNTLPISDVKVMLNGALVLGKCGSPPGSAMRRPIDVKVDLEEGTNIISIMASNEKAMSEPETRKIVYRAGSGVEQKGKLIAIAVGISRYARPGISLKYGDADAAAMEAALKNQLDPQHILYNSVEVHVLTNDKAKRGDILRELDWMNTQATQKDTRVLFLSGHGAVDSGNNYFFFSHEHDPDDYDLGDVPWDLIVRKLTASGRAILLVDSCHAGAVTGNKPKDGVKTLAQIIKETNTQQLGLVTFASSERNEDSEERDTFRHGAFTQALIEGVNDRKADLNGDGVIETQELGTWIVRRVRELTAGSQHAVYLPAPEVSFAAFRGKQ